MLGFNLRHFQNSYASGKACSGLLDLSLLQFSKAAVLLLLTCYLVCFPLVVGVLCVSLFCCALLCVLSKFAIILKRKREQVALLLLSYGCLVTINVLWLFLTVPWLGDNTHFFYVSDNRRLKREGSFEPSLLTDAIRTKIPYANTYYTLHCKWNLYKLVKKCDFATEFNIRYIFSGYVSKCLLFDQIGTCGFLSLFYNDYRARGTDKNLL